MWKTYETPCFAVMDQAKFRKSFQKVEAIYGRSPSEIEVDRAWTIYSRVLKRELGEA